MNKSIIEISDDFSRSDVIAKIKNADIEDLRNPAYLEHVIIPQVGLDRFIAEHYPENLRQFCGKNFMACQMPTQLSKYLAYLSTKKSIAISRLALRWAELSS